MEEEDIELDDVGSVDTPHDDFLSRSKFAIRDMMETDGWHLMRKMLLIERSDQIMKMLGLLPAPESLPAYGAARAKISLIDQLLTAQPGDIAEVIYNERNNRS